MKEGPELDKLVAEKVIGWIKPSKTSILKSMWVAPPLGTVYPNLPKFSGKIDDAWMVVEFLENNVGGIELTSLCDDKKYLFRIWNGKRYIEVNAETAPLAICLAALKAVGIEVDSD